MPTSSIEITPLEVSEDGSFITFNFNFDSFAFTAGDGIVLYEGSTPMSFFDGSTPFDILTLTNQANISKKYSFDYSFTPTFLYLYDSDIMNPRLDVNFVLRGAPFVISPFMFYKKREYSSSFSRLNKRSLKTTSFRKNKLSKES